MFVSSNLLTDLLPYFKRKLKRIYDEREIESLFYLSCQHYFGLSKLNLLNHQKRLTESELLFFRDLVERLGNNEPIQYVFGIEFFYGLKFNVSPFVLIPRPETEELVDMIVKNHKSANNLSLLDIGTGSGCIAISLSKNLNNATVFGLDISDEALVIAGRNAESNSTNVIFKQADILVNDLNDLPYFDLIVSNPPYIPESDKEQMHANVLTFEPELALFVADTDPLIFYKRIVNLGLKKLKDGGKIYFEIHYQYGSEILEILTRAGYESAVLQKDLSGLDRFVIATK